MIARANLPADMPSLHLGSPAFADGARIPIRYTADGEGVSPPLVWNQLPDGTSTLALIVEDADAPALRPLVHAIVWNIAPENGALREGAIRKDGAGDEEGRDVGRNSFFEGWLPPDPPTGHGEHRYVFQLFALADPVDPGASPRRSALIKAMEGKILAAGVLTGTYSRGDPAVIGPVGAVAVRSA